MRIDRKIGVLAGVASLGMLASAANAADYLIGIQGTRGLEAKIEKAGGTLTRSYPFGLVVASSDAPDFADRLGNSIRAQFIVEDVGFTVEAPVVERLDEAGYPPNSGDDDFFFDLQWGHNYVGAQEAWAAGHRGQGVLVAVLDGGFEPDHPDLAPNVYHVANMTEQDFNYNNNCPGDPFSHGNHVAGTIAAADNGYGAIGVAPEASLMLVKVLEDTETCSGSGSFTDIIEGIYYATMNGADVINMSLGTQIPRIGNRNFNSLISDLQIAVNTAITYAHLNGTTVIVSAGNGGGDLDGGNKSAVRFNTGMSHAVGISALAPHNWAGNHAAGNGDVPLDPAGYTDYGTSMVDFGSPGGDWDYVFDDLADDGAISFCNVAGIVRPCYVFDYVFSTGSFNGSGNPSWYWSVGTSMAAPHAAGVAALIISETGNSDPDQVIREMRLRAEDAGKPGRDDFYGHGITHSGH